MPEPDYFVEFYPADNPETWEAEFAAQGIGALEGLLARHAGFLDYLAAQGEQ